MSSLEPRSSARAQRRVTLNVGRFLPLVVSAILAAVPCVGQADLESGVVVEHVPSSSTLAAAGLRPGDIVLAWERPSDRPTGPEPARGELHSPFDWAWLRLEQAPRGTVRLIALRDGRRQALEVERGPWAATVRPRVRSELRDNLLEGRALIAGQDPAAARRLWAPMMASDETDRGLRAWLHVAIAEAWEEVGEPQEAIASYRQALEQAEEPLTRALIWQALGVLHRRSGELDDAEEAHDAALELHRAVAPDSLGIARSLTGLGRVAEDRSELASASKRYEKALEIRRRLAAGSLEVAAGLSDLGNVAQETGDLRKAETYYRQALEIERRLAPGGLQLAGSLGNLGNLTAERGDLEQALSYYQEVLDIAQHLEPDGLIVAYTLNNLGTVFWERGDLERAADHHQRGLEIERRLAPGSLSIASSLDNLGNVAAARGDAERAALHYHEALEIERRVAPQSLDVAYTLINLALLEIDLGELRQAESHLQEALTIERHHAPQSPAVALTLNNLGLVALRNGELERSEDLFRRSIELKRGYAPNSLDFAHTLHHLGLVALKKGQLEEALRHLEPASEIRARLAPGSTLEAETLHALGDVARARHRPAEAASSYLRAVVALEGQLGKLGGSHGIRAGFRSRYGGYYRDLIEVQLELGRQAEAFQTLERSRARTFLAQLAERDTVFSADIPEELDRQRRQLGVRHDRTLQRLSQLDPTRDAEAVEAGLEALRELRQDASEVEEAIRRASPRLAALHYPEPLGVAGARAALDPGTALLSYSVGEARTDLFVLSRDQGLSVATLPLGEEELRRQVETFQELVQGVRSRRTIRWAPLEATARRLYAELIAPVEPRLAASERLLVVPDGPLQLLPFAALRRDAGARAERASGGRYLVEWKPIHTVLSATVYAELKAARPGADRTGDRAPPAHLVAFGDPSYPGQLLRGSPEQLPDVRLRAAADRGRFELFDWDALPHSRREVEGIVRLYPEETARAYLGTEATEERLKSIADDARILHLAAHGYYDEALPMSSAVVLTIPRDWREGEDNGLLQAWEIFEQLRLDADLVVLSACRSAHGRHLDGEGLVGLTRAFQYAGARSVLATLWNVADDATAELMVRFYRHLRAGAPKDEALRRAQLELIRGPIESRGPEGRPAPRDVSAPFYWAAFRLIGDWR